MSNEVELPPLPPEVEPKESWRKASRQSVRDAFAHYRETMGLSVDDMRMFTADQMRDYARAAVLQERERCARVCEEVERKQENDNGMANTGGAAECAAAIRKPSPPDSHNGCG
jgi:hypothetical protein